jgi:hypothetical protein
MKWTTSMNMDGIPFSPAGGDGSATSSLSLNGRILSGLPTIWGARSELLHGRKGKDANPKLKTDMLNDYKRWAERIGLTTEDSDAVLSHILTQYKLRDEAERQGCDWGDIISEILEEKNLIRKYIK